MDFIKYKIKSNFSYTSGFEINSEIVYNALSDSNLMLRSFPENLYKTIDLKTTSAIIGAIFCSSLANRAEGAIVNPIEKGNPDVVPEKAKNATEEQLRKYPEGVEIKCTAGNIKTGIKLRAGQQRFPSLTGITWQAHHQEGKSILGLVWDFFQPSKNNSFFLPGISAAFFSSNLNKSDWGAISGTTGRNTKVCGMTSSGKEKMKNGWIVINDSFFERCIRLL